jgi:hypothetical protein
MPVSSVSKPGPRRPATSSPALHAPASAPVESIVSAENLAGIDDELARQAEQTLQQDLSDSQFDLEGEFLSQAEIAKIMAAEGAGSAAASAAPAAPVAKPVMTEPAAPAVRSAGGQSRSLRQSAGNQVEISDLKSETTSIATASEPAGVAGAQVESAAAPALAPSQDQPIVESSAATDAPSMTAAPAAADRSSDAPNVAQGPAAASDSAPRLADSAGRSAGGVDEPVQPVAPAEAAAAVVAKVTDGPATPSAEDAKPADSSVAKATPSAAPAEAIKPKKPAEPPAGGASPQPAGEIEASADQGEEAGERFPRWQQAILSVATMADTPFAGLPRLIKMILGIVGGVVFLAGVAVWVMGAR